MKMFLCFSGASLMHSAHAVGLRGNGPLDTPDLTPYDPIEVLCAKGRDDKGAPKIQAWCDNWVKCIQAGAQPASDAAAVMNAWSPADCKEVCGEWPVTSPPEGSMLLEASGVKKANASMAAGAVQRLFGGRAGDCPTSCGNFQEKLSTCVSKILFEPGQVAGMGLNEELRAANKPAAPEYCTAKETPCQPDLQINYHKCVSQKTKAKLRSAPMDPAEKSRCETVKSDVEYCKDCPQVAEGYQSQYHVFVGGCMSQLNAYWQATHPQAGEAAIPGAKGCTVH